MNWKGRKVLVTGAGGFIGSHLVEALVKRGARTTTLVHYNSRNDWGWIEALPETVKKKLSVFPGDVRDPENVRKAVRGQEVVFHLAALIAIPFSYEAPESYLSTNLRGTMNVLQACLEAKVQKLVHTSTSEVYGTAQYTPIDEKHPLQAQSPYAASKIGADKMAESYFYSYQLPVTILRPFNTFGPRQSARAIIPTIITQACSGRKIAVGSIKPIRDFMFVEDTVMGFLRIAESSKTVGETINIGTGQGITIKELIHIIQRITKREFRVISDHRRVRPVTSEVMRLICDFRKAKKLMNWEPTCAVEEGLEKTVQWMDRRLSYYKAHLYNI